MKMMHIWSTFRLMVANPGRLWIMAAIVTKNRFFFFLNSLNIVKSNVATKLQRNNAYIILFQTMNDDPDCHQTWPLPLLKKSVKNRKLLKKLDSSLKPFGQMNRNLVGSIYGKSSVVIAHFVPIR